jgi:hypothetical protein
MNIGLSFLERASSEDAGCCEPIEVLEAQQAFDPVLVSTGQVQWARSRSGDSPPMAVEGQAQLGPLIRAFTDKGWTESRWSRVSVYHSLSSCSAYSITNRLSSQALGRPM